MTAEEIIALMSDRFTSGNSVKVERAHVTRDEWRELLDRFRYAADMGYHGTSDAVGRPCPNCCLAKAIDAALEKLS